VFSREKSLNLDAVMLKEIFMNLKLLTFKLVLLIVSLNLLQKRRVANLQLNYSEGVNEERKRLSNLMISTFN
jgi:cyclopropane fatty-acyl-phospholipid synthase-like methyltransferase